MSTHTARRNSNSSSASLLSMLTESSSSSVSSADMSAASSCSSPDELLASAAVAAAGPSSHRLTLADIHIPAGFEIAKDLGQDGKGYPAEDCIVKAADVLKSLRGRMPDGSDGQVAACDYCRRRKIRCDRAKPTCGSCVQTERKCTTEDMLRKRGPPSKKERAVLEAAGIIFRGTRPHRRRRTATTSLGSGAAASKQQELMTKALKESVGGKSTRVRSHSTNTTAITVPASMTAAALAHTNHHQDGGSKSSWMEMLSLASQTSNPFAESPVSSPSDLSPSDTVHLDAGACDYLLPMAQFGALTPHGSEEETLRNAPWDSMWTTFKQQSRQPFKEALAPAFLSPQDMLAKTQVLPASPYASLEAGALDWSHSQFSLQQYQSLYPTTHTETNVASKASAQPQQMFGSNVYAAEDAAAFQSAMSHFFPTPAPSEPTPQQHYSSDSSSPTDPNPMPFGDAVASPQSTFSIDQLTHPVFSIDAPTAL